MAWSIIRPWTYYLIDSTSDLSPTFCVSNRRWDIRGVYARYREVARAMQTVLSVTEKWALWSNRQARKGLFDAICPVHAASQPVAAHQVCNRHHNHSRRYFRLSHHRRPDIQLEPSDSSCCPFNTLVDAPNLDKNDNSRHVYPPFSAYSTTAPFFHYFFDCSFQLMCKRYISKDNCISSFWHYEHQNISTDKAMTSSWYGRCLLIMICEWDDHNFTNIT